MLTQLPLPLPIVKGSNDELATRWTVVEPSAPTGRCRSVSIKDSLVLRPKPHVFIHIVLKLENCLTFHSIIREASSQHSQMLKLPTAEHAINNLLSADGLNFACFDAASPRHERRRERSRMACWPRLLRPRRRASATLRSADALRQEEHRAR